MTSHGSRTTTAALCKILLMAVFTLGSALAATTLGVAQDAAAPARKTAAIAKTQAGVPAPTNDVAPAQEAVVPLAPPARIADTCFEKSGLATAVTRLFAEHEAFLVVRQTSGNWPIQNDRVGQPSYACKAEGMMWSCVATARICKGQG